MVRLSRCIVRGANSWAGDVFVWLFPLWHIKKFIHRVRKRVAFSARLSSYSFGWVCFCWAAFTVAELGVRGSWRNAGMGHSGVIVLDMMTAAGVELAYKFAHCTRLLFSGKYGALNPLAPKCSMKWSGIEVGPRVSRRAGKGKRRCIKRNDLDDCLCEGQGDNLVRWMVVGGNNYWNSLSMSQSQVILVVGLTLMLKTKSYKGIIFI